MTQLAATTDEPGLISDAVYSAASTVLLRRYAEHRRSQAFTARGQLARLREIFDELVEWWLEDTAILSSTTAIVGHRAYRLIIEMGQPAVPLILGELAEEPDHWGPALVAITGEDPVPPEDEGDVAAMARAWIAWGKDKGMLP